VTAGWLVQLLPYNALNVDFPAKAGVFIDKGNCAHKTQIISACRSIWELQT